MGLVVGFDVGGNDIKTGAINSEGEALTSIDPHQVLKVPSLAIEGPRKTVEQLNEALSLLNIERGDIQAIGLATAGPATLDGVIPRSVNFGPEWVDCHIRQMVEDRFQLPTTYENDANAAALAEMIYLVRQSPDLKNSTGFLLTIGTGLGGGIIVNGEILRGAHGMGGEVGHIALRDPTTFIAGNIPQCGCQKFGCAETYTTLSFLDRELRESLKNNPSHELSALPDNGFERAKKLLSLAAKGDSLARRLMLAQAENVGKTCYEITATIDPSWILIGGGITEASSDLRRDYLHIVKETFDKLAFQGQKGKVLIEYASMGDHAGWFGAARSALRANA